MWTIRCFRHLVALNSEMSNSPYLHFFLLTAIAELEVERVDRYFVAAYIVGSINHSAFPLHRPTSHRHADHPLQQLPAL